MPSHTFQKTAQEHNSAVPKRCPKRYAFFSFFTTGRLASEYGHCSGQVDLRTGEILANISYGLFQYREDYRLNIKNRVSDFPHTTEELIVCAARRAAEIDSFHNLTQK